MDFQSANPTIVKSIKQRDLLNTWLRLYAREQQIPRIGEYQPTRLAEELPDLVQSRRLRAETMFIYRLAVRLADRLGKSDPLAQRVGLTRKDGVLSLLRALGALVWR